MLRNAIPELDRRGLRSFGLATGLTVAALFGLALPWLLEHQLPIWPWAVAGVLLVVGTTAPTMLRPVYRTWMAFGLLMSRVTTPLLLGVLFLLVVTPIARLRAIFGNDPLSRHLAPSAKSYRIASRPTTVHDLEKPY